MLGVLLVAFVALPLVELYVIVQVGQAWGFLNTIGVMLLISVGGAWLARHEGFVVLRRFRAQLERHQVPGDELIDGALVLSGGLLLLTPGFVTDGVGLLLLFPATRLLARTWLRRRLRVQVLGHDGWRRGGPDDVIDV